MEEEITIVGDIAEGTFIEKWPKWLRWISFLPAAFLGSAIVVIIIGILNWISLKFIGVTEDGWLLTIYQLGQSYFLGYLFVFFGSTVAPKQQFVVSIILLIIATILTLLSFLLNFTTQSTNSVLMLFHSLLTIVGSGVAVYQIHSGENLFT